MAANNNARGGGGGNGQMNEHVEFTVKVRGRETKWGIVRMQLVM